MSFFQTHLLLVICFDCCTKSKLIQRYYDYFNKKQKKQTNKQTKTNKQTNKRTNKQKQLNKQTKTYLNVGSILVHVDHLRLFG